MTFKSSLDPALTLQNIETFIRGEYLCEALYYVNLCNLLGYSQVCSVVVYECASFAFEFIML